MSEFQPMFVDVLTKLYKQHVTKDTIDALEKQQWQNDLWQQLVAHELHNVGQHEAGDFSDVCALHRVSGYFAAPVPFIEHTLACSVLTYMERPMEQATYTIAMDAQVPWGRVADYVVVVKRHALMVYKTSTLTLQHGQNMAAEPRDRAHFPTDPCALYEISETQYARICAMMTQSALCKITGAVERAVALSVQFSREREQFGRPIHRFQLIQQHIAKLAGEEAILQAACDAMQVNDRLAIGAARIRADEAIQLVTASAHQVHAAIGVTHEHALHHVTRRLWAWRDEGWTARDWKAMLANDMLHDEASLWDLLTAERTEQH